MMQRAAVLDGSLDHVSQSEHQAETASDQAMAPAEAIVRQAETSELVARASLGDQVAWDRLVERYGGMVWALARAHGLGPRDAADVSQVAWLLLTQHLGLLQQPERLGVWLHATATREAFRMCRLRGREVHLAGEHDLGELVASGIAH
jgi:DNA-directed RNA polymerase specialized sigma24 family protein